MSKRKFVLYEIDPKAWGIKESKLTNIPLISHLQECAEIERLIHLDEFCSQSTKKRRDQPITALSFDWYGRSLDLITLLLQRTILGTEAFISGVVLQEIVVRQLVTPKTREFVKNPFVLKGRGTADNFYNKLPAQIDSQLALEISDPALWSDVKEFYREVRNPLFHGYQLNT